MTTFRNIPIMYRFILNALLVVPERVEERELVSPTQARPELID